MLLGAGLAAWAIVSGRASVMYTFYAPLQAHWTFYLGLALLVVSTWLTSLNMFLALRSWRRDNPGERIPLLAYISIATYVMWDLASIGIAVEVVGILLPWSLGMIDRVDPLLTRTLFWFSRPTCSRRRSSSTREALQSFLDQGGCPTAFPPLPDARWAAPLASCRCGRKSDLLVETAGNGRGWLLPAVSPDRAMRKGGFR